MNPSSHRRNADSSGRSFGFLRKGALLFLFSVQISLQGFSAAGPLDLGQNLSYLRLRGHPDDVPALTEAWSSPALILDLRHPAADAAKYIPANLPDRPGAKPLFVLVGPATPADALAALRASAPGIITLGLSAPGLTPDIPVAVKPGDDLRAFEAFDSGTSLESLLSETIAKTRFDEAALLHERAQEAGAAAATAASAATAAPPASPPGPPAPAAVTPPEPKDAVLQRAVQLHRALLALGKLMRN